jgi:fatty-acyl-CoA synthase
MTDTPRPAKPHKSPADVVRTARRHTAATSLLLAVVGLLALAFAPFGVREAMFGLDYAVTTVALGWAATLAMLAVILAILALLLTLAVAPRRGFVMPMLALVIGAALIAATGQLRAVVASNPPVHEVATDWEEPLMFGPRASAARGPGANPLSPDPRVGIQRAPPRHGRRAGGGDQRPHLPAAVPW